MMYRQYTVINCNISVLGYWRLRSSPSFAVSLRSWRRPSNDRFLDADLISPRSAPETAYLWSNNELPLSKFTYADPFASFWTKSC
uniref:Uncharacterized protein n=1 Tax=Pseudomonas aeruginosa TaxID=287 RepID=A0A1P8L017_PSEAI|nr:hypothetical protein TN6350_00004 [Pseudomonas aeruginosa]